MLDVLALFWSVPAFFVLLSISKQTRALIKDDLLRLSDGSSWISIHKQLLHNKVFRKIFLMRILSESTIKYRIVRLIYPPLDSLEISSTTNQIGGGLMVYHGYSTIIFCHSMGKNCTVYQNVTIGRGKMVCENDVPIIGDNVTIYAGANVIGGITIGNNVVIGAGTTVVKDVPDNTVVVGAENRYRRKCVE